MCGPYDIGPPKVVVGVVVLSVGVGIRTVVGVGV